MKYNILYYQGLDSFLSEDKKAILEKIGRVRAPVIDYRKAASINVVIEEHSESFLNDIDIVIRSTMGGLVAYDVCQRYNLPCLYLILRFVIIV